MIPKRQESLGIHLVPLMIYKKYQKFEKIIWYPLWFYKRNIEILKKSQGTAYDFQTHQKKYRIIDVWLLLLRSLVQNYSLEKSWKILLVPPPWKNEKSRFRGGVLSGKATDLTKIKFVQTALSTLFYSSRFYLYYIGSWEPSRFVFSTK